MRFLHVGSNLNIEIVENIVNTITIESPVVFRKLIRELWGQCNGMEGGWILSEADKELSITKTCDIIFNPFSVDVNDKKILSVLYSRINDLIEEEHFGEMMELNSSIMAFIERVIDDLDYPIISDYEMDIIGILKNYHVRLDEDSGVNRIVDYMRLRHQIIGTSIFIWVNGKQYLTDNEMKELYKSSCYDKIQIIVIEGVFSNRFDFENSLIIDKDLCVM